MAILRMTRCRVPPKQPMIAFVRMIVRGGALTRPGQYLLAELILLVLPVGGVGIR